MRKGSVPLSMSKAITSPEQLIVTAASEAYGPSLLSLLGSLNLNWPYHPPVLVYDIGLDASTLSVLESNRISVRRVPPFCPHWRKHYTWKLWCLNDAPSQDILWLDAGLIVLSPLDEVFKALQCHGYFVATNYQLLDWEASEAACKGCGVPPEFRHGKLTLSANLMGFRKADHIQEILMEALSVAQTEEHIAATAPTHRHDQAIISLLMYKHLGNAVLSDGIVYAGWLSPRQTPGQKVWAHRRTLRKHDQTHFSNYISRAGAPYLPECSRVNVLSQLRSRIPRIVITVVRWCLCMPRTDKAQISDGIRD